MAANDFFLKFDSNARQFSSEMAGELSKGVGEINALTEALIKYDETVGSMRAGNPLGGMFTQLDQASSKLQGIGNEISSQFAKITDSLGRLSKDLTAALDQVTSAAAASRTAQWRQKKRDGENLTADEAVRRRAELDAQQRKVGVASVTEGDLSPAKLRQTQSTIAKATKDGNDARNAVKRVADINATLARNATDSANALGKLGEAIRGLTTKTKTTTKGVEEGRFQSVAVHVHGNVSGGGDLGNINIGGLQQLLASAGVADAAQAPARDAAHQAQRDAKEAKSRALALEQAQFGLPARPGAYQVPGEAQPRIVGHRLQPGETFEGYFNRSAANSQGLNQVRKDVVAASEQRVGIQASRDLQKVQQLIGRRALEELVGDEKLREAARVPGSIPTETIRASVSSRLAPGQSLSPAQYEKVPAAVAEFIKMQEDFAKFARGDVLKRVQANPDETFAFGVESRRKDVFGTQGDYRAQVARHDQTDPHSPGAQYRAQAESAVGESAADRKALQGGYRDLDFYGRQAEGSTYRTPHPVLGDTGGKVHVPQAEELPQRNPEVAAALKEDAAIKTAEARVQNITRILNEVNAADFSDPKQQERASRAAITGAGLPRRFGYTPPTQASPEGTRVEQFSTQEEVRSFLQARLEAAEQAAAEAAATAPPPPPPKPPKPPKAGSNSEQPPEEPTGGSGGTGGGAGSGSAARRRVAGTPFPITDNVRAFEQSLGQATREIIAAERAALPGLTGAARQNSIERAGSALRNDPAFGSLGSLSQQRTTLGTLLQLPRGGASNTALSSVFGRGGSGSASLGAAEAAATRDSASADADAAAALSRYNSIREMAAGLSSEMRSALLRQLAAQEKLTAAENADVRNVGRLIAAERELVAARGAVARVAAAEQPKSVQQQLFGQRGFKENQLRHIGLGLENTIGYTLVFTGLEKLKEVVHNGLESEAAFTRLQQSLDANGISADGLRQKLANISAETATPLETVIEAASELSGTLKNTGDLKFGTEVAAQLANISQGTLTAKEAAVGLRDVIAAYGDQWAASGVSVQQGIKQTGDDIAKLSQLTGVNVKDITQGTTQIAAEARDFGLNQRQASTIAAYVTQGTGETGEQAASQTSRLLSGLYNSRTQEALQRVLKPTNPEGKSIQQQFATGDIGGVLTELIGQYGTLNDSSKQFIASLIGTGITARAFAALVGGGANAVKALNGQLEDTNALSKQNKTYLQTVAGQIKELDEDFQNLGSSLQRLGAFDALGALAKGFDDVFKAANLLFGKLADLADMTGFTREVLHLAVALGEAAVAWKLLGSPLTRGILGTSIGNRAIGGVAVRNAEEVAAAEAGTVSRRYRFRDVATQFGRNARGGFAKSEEQVAQETARSAEQRQIAATTSVLSQMDAQTLRTTDALAQLASAATAAATGEEEVAAASTAAAETQAVVASEQAATLPVLATARATQLALPFGAASSEAATAAARAEQQMLLPLQFRSPTTGRFASPSALASEDAARAAAAEGALPGMTRAELAAQNASRTGGLLPFPAAAPVVPPGEAGSAARAGRFARFGRMGGVLPAAALAYVGLQYLHGADQEEDQRNGSAGRLLAGGTSQADLGRLNQPRSFLDYNANSGLFTNKIPVLHTLGQVGNMLEHAAGLTFGDSATGPSQKSNDRYFKLFNSVVGGFKKGTPGAEAVGDGETIKDTLPKLHSVEAVQKFQKGVLASIEKQRDDIQKAGGNDKQAQAQIAFSINQLESNVQSAAQHRLAAIKGLSNIDVMNSQQITDLQSALGSVAQLNPNTLSTQSEAIRNLVQSGTVTPGSGAYKDLLTAAGLSPQGPARPQANVLGVNPAGQYGWYNSRGKFSAGSPFDGGTQSLLPGGPGQKIYDPTASYNPANGTPAHTLGINEQGQIGSYDKLGRFTQHEGYVSPSQAQALQDSPRISAPRQVSGTQMLRALQGGYQKSIDQANLIIESIGKPGGPTDAKIQAAQQQLTTGLSGYQQVTQQLYQSPIQRAQGQASVAASLSGTGGTLGTGEDAIRFGTGNGASIALLREANRHIGTYNSTLKHDNPEFWSNLAQYESNKQQIAQLAASPQATALAIQAASTSDAVTKAQLVTKQAVLTYNTHKAGGASADVLGQDQAAIAAGKLGEQQAGQAVVSAQYQLQITQDRNSVRRGQDQLNQALQAEVVYRKGGLADQASLLQAQGQEVQARQSIRDAIEAQRESAIEGRAALAKFHGDDVAASADELRKAEDAYAYAVREYGRKSNEANAAYTNVITTRSSHYDAVTAQITAGLDLQVSELNARGVGQGSDLGQQAAQVSLQSAQTLLNRYLKKGGKKGTAEYDKLYGAVITAQRTAFDTALNAQLDTLDFQQQTYQITSGQEIASLQQILKNKQLTLAEQRQITLKIKGLQNSIREQLTAGGLNIPSDIKLPTAYEVRRSLGPGFTGSATHANVVNNNQQSTVTINQTLPSHTLANAVANQVIDIINRQTGQQVRANSPTPRNVPVGRR